MVLLIDADLRRPSLHKVFGLDNETGLTTLLDTEPPSESGGLTDSEAISASIQDTVVPGLRIITSGTPPSNPAEVLGSVAMGRWFKYLEQANDVDVIFIDSAPALAVSDSGVLAATTGASVVLVIKSGKTRRTAALEIKQQFKQLGLDVKGMVINGVNRRYLKDRGYLPQYHYANPQATTETIPYRGTLEGAQWKRPKVNTRQLNGGAKKSQGSATELPRDGLVLFVNGRQDPLTVIVPKTDHHWPL